jgi:hypothetical protein
MKSSFLVKWFFLAITIFLISACSILKPVSQSDMIGAWYHPNSGTMADRFGHSILYFDWDGTLYVSELDYPVIKELRYEFIAESTIAVTGDEDLASKLYLSMTSNDMLLYCADYENPFSLHITCIRSPELQRLTDYEASGLRAKYWGEWLDQTEQKKTVKWWHVLVAIFVALWIMAVIKGER